MPTDETVRRIAAVLAILVIVNVFVIASVPQVFVKRQIALDWPLIAEYALFFVAVGVLHALRGAKGLGMATALFGIAAAVFDVRENLAALEANRIVSSPGKWLCYSAATVLTALLFARQRSVLARMSFVLLLLGGAAGVVLSFFLPGARLGVLASAFVALLGLMTAVVVLMRR